MFKALALVLAAAALASPVAQAGGSTDGRAFQREIARTTSPGVGERIAAQERGRGGDAQVVGRPDPAPVQVMGDPDRFDLVDAGIGGAFAFAVALMAAAGVAVWNTSRRRTA